RSAPSVAAAALVNYPPLSSIRVDVPVSIEGLPPPREDQPWVARHWVVYPGYFSTAGIPIRAGRDFTPAADALQPGVAIVSGSLGGKFGGAVDVVGHSVRPEFPGSALFWIPLVRQNPLRRLGVDEEGSNPAAWLARDSRIESNGS